MKSIEYYNIRKKGMIYKIDDFEKVYDHVDETFLDKVLEKKGFGYK